MAHIEASFSWNLVSTNCSFHGRSIARWKKVEDLLWRSEYFLHFLQRAAVATVPEQKRNWTWTRNRVLSQVGSAPEEGWHRSIGGLILCVISCVLCISRILYHHKAISFWGWIINLLSDRQRNHTRCLFSKWPGKLISFVHHRNEWINSNWTRSKNSFGSIHYFRPLFQNASEYSHGMLVRTNYCDFTLMIKLIGWLFQLIDISFCIQTKVHLTY